VTRLRYEPPTEPPPAERPSAERPPADRRRLWLYVALGAVVVAAGGFVVLRLALPLPEPRIVQMLPASYTIPGAAPVVPWPRSGQAAMEIEGLGSLGQSENPRPVPIASVAKVMTAHLILHDHPMAPNEDGAALTVSDAEAAAYPSQLASGQSLVQVEAGEVLSERQALEALLLPSANNIAHILARWDAGGDEAFVTKMNKEATRLGMHDTHYTDPSGLDAATVSTAADQIALARAAMKSPTLAQIVAMPQATIPVVGVVKNVNSQLGQDGVVGIKTGSTDDAGGCLLFAADLTVAGKKLRLIGAVLGMGSGMSDAFGATHSLLQFGGGLLHQYRVVHAGQAVARVMLPLGRSTTLAASSDLDVIGWPGLSFRIDTLATVPARIASAAGVGTLTLSATEPAATTAVQTTGALIPPAWWQRLLH
jgi:D-alanyl-D-alanine carboxypeptidase (penicillin-binding protein 5/6)